MRIKEASLGLLFVEQFDGALGAFLVVRRRSDVGVGFAIRTRLLLCKSRLFCVTREKKSKLFFSARFLERANLRFAS